MTERMKTVFSRITECTLTAILLAACDMVPVEPPQGLEIPSSAPQDNIVEYQGYVTSYNTQL